MESPSPISQPSMESDATFRAFKRRKLFRPRELSPSPARHDEPYPPDTSPNSVSLEHGHSSLTKTLNQYRTAVRKRSGIRFSASEDAPHEHHSANRRITEVDLNEVGTRFAPQTGQVADVDKHMMAYVDAEIARRFRPPSPDSSTHKSTNGCDGQHQDHSVHRQPAALGRIMEIDLPGAEAKNVAATKAATERARASEEGTTEPKIDRTGKKGRRRRRNSEDLRRDQIVEQVLRENRIAVDVYDEPVTKTLDAGGDEESEEAADERVAEQFRREFLDAQQARRRRQPTSNVPKGKETKESKSKGPKLGGSRSARAAMRERELAEKKGPGGH